MIKKIKDKLIFIIPFLLILYFTLNLLGGNRGLFSYFEKRNYLNNLKNEVKIIRQEIEDLEKSNILLSSLIAILGVPLDLLAISKAAVVSILTFNFFAFKIIISFKLSGS